ncbi:sensor histidine kinase [Clostridium isatidis]|uniref:histidine kinase n=1 Tax=Clostridium isatidis TaxID=182773 RepID=A0A343JF00_9CLOT|nr:two-component sensor histidine kinase [Clostridium isatidis]NLZ35812.1 HAMP domain-containing histidine kinase [Clostridiales bacterium]
MEAITRKSIKVQVVRIILITISLIILILNILLMIFLTKYYYDNTEDLLRSRINVSLSIYEKYFYNSNLNEIINDDVDIFWKDNNVQVEIFDKNRELIMDSIGAKDEDFIKKEDVIKASKGEISRWIGKVNYTKSKVMAVSAPIIIDGEIIGIIRLITSLDDVNKIITNVILRFSLISIIAFVIGILLSILLADKIIKPIKYLTEVAKEMAGGNLKIRSSIKSQNEIGQLSNALNFMAGEVESREQLKNEFISSVSHELRTPLTAIKGWSITLRDDETDKETLELGLNIIEKEADRLTVMVEELLNFSNLLNENMRLNIETISISKLLNEVKAIMERRALSEKINFTVNCNIETTIDIDVNRIKQVFINLLDNAFNFTGENGEVKVDVSEEDKNIIFLIKDNGCGIRKEDLPRVKEKFFKGKNSKSKNGIGLSICDEIIRLHNGELKILSEEGVGTEVYVILNKTKEDKK